MRYGEGLLEEILRRTDLVQLVGRRVKLNRKGRVFWGCCPFHKEKSPSFKVENERRTYHCFGCNQGGDIFTFVEQMEGVDFKGALKILAERAGESHVTYARGINPQFVKVLRTIGFDREWVRTQGAYLFDAAGNRYLDLLGGFGMFNVGRNNARVRDALVQALELEVPRRAEWIRVLFQELARLHSHLVFLGTGSVDLGGIALLFYCFRARDEVLDLFEMACGAWKYQVWDLTDASGYTSIDVWGNGGSASLLNIQSGLNLTIGVVSGYGTVNYDRGLCSAAAVLERGA